MHPKGAEKLLFKAIRCDYAIKNTALGLIGKICNLRKKTESGKILLFRQGGLGDALSALPALNMIRQKYPQADIDLLTNIRPDWQAGIDSIVPGKFRRVYRYKHLFNRQMISLLRKEKYDSFIILPNYVSSFSFNLRLLVLSVLVRVRSVTGWQVASTKFLRKRQEKWINFEPDEQRLEQLLNKAGFALADSKPQFETNSEDFINIINTYKLQNRRKNIAMVIGAGRPQNKWPISHFIAVAEHFTKSGYNILMLGGEKEKTEVNEFFRTDQGVYNFCGNYTIEQSATLLRHCIICISNDTGLMHLSYKCGTPVVSIFSARDYSGKWFPPLDDKNIVLRNTEVHCAICFSNTCMNNICMQSITPGEVISKANELIKKLEFELA